MKPQQAIWIAALLFFFAACRKSEQLTPLPEEQLPQMEVSNLADKAITYGQPGFAIDVNKDGRLDLFFGVQLVGDPLAQVDKRQYFAQSDIYTNLLVTPSEQTLPFNLNEKIEVENFRQSTWYNASSINIMERVEHVSGSIVWNGNWLGLSRRYLPFQLLKNNQRYNGWVELSAEPENGRLVLHRAAICKEAEKEIRAGN